MTSTMFLAADVLTPRTVVDGPRFRDYVHACDQHILWSEGLVWLAEHSEIFAFTWNEGEDISDPGVGVGPITISSNGEENVYPVCDANTIAWIKKTSSGDSIVTRQIDGGPHYEISLDGAKAWDLDLSDGNLVWRQQEGEGTIADVRWATLGADGVYTELSDRPPVTVLNDVSFNITAPKVTGSTLVWDDYDPGLAVFVVRKAELTSPNIYETLSEDLPLNSHHPNISSDNVVWMTNEINNGYYNQYFIYLKQGDNSPAVLDMGQWTDEGDSYRCRIPQIEGNRVSWIRFLNKNGFPWGGRIMTYDFGPDGIYDTLDDIGLSQKTYLTDFFGGLGMTGELTAAILFREDYVTTEVLSLSSE